MALENGPDTLYSVGWSKHEFTVVTGLVGVTKELIYAFVTRSTVGVDCARLVDVVEQKSVRRALSSVRHNPEHHLLHFSAPSPKHDPLVTVAASPDEGLVDLNINLKFLRADIDQMLPEATIPASARHKRHRGHT